MPFTTTGFTRDIPSTSPDPQELTLADPSSGEVEIQSLDISSNLSGSIAESLTPLTTASALESVLNEPLTTTTSVATKDPVDSKIDIIS